MDGPPLCQRPASNTSLHNTYRNHARPINYASHRPASHRRPLRSVNENVALLRSPGPLQSMLKNTTETGDIGVFSIKPRSLSTAAPIYFQSSRSRSHFGDSCYLPVPYARGYEDNYLYDDHRRFRSNRDTTSEIISLYGSESQQTMPTSVSPSFDDGLRSYSLTTTSSRHAPFRKSPGMLQSQPSAGAFQRPRSPFPYPTRLKRPGVRPASPALAENGNIDYSRMVELERFSQRTVHGSYKPTYAHGHAHGHAHGYAQGYAHGHHRRLHPLSLRAEATRSSTSLPSRTSPLPYYHGPPNYRARTPNSFASWTSRHSDRHNRASTDQSTRSASLTSIVEMYNRPIDATANTNGQPLHSTGSFYYDYTEEFANQPPPDLELEIPICPIPQRAGSISRPMVLREDSSIGLGPVENGVDEATSDDPRLFKEGKPFSTGSDGNGDGLDIDDNGPLNHRRELDGNKTVHSHATYKIMDIAKSSHPAATTSGLAGPEQGTSNPPKTKSAPHRRPKDGLSEVPSSPVTSRGNPEVSPYGPSDGPGGMAALPAQAQTWQYAGALRAGSHVDDNVQSRRGSQSSLSRLKCILDPALSDFASILSSLDRLGKSPSLERQSEAQSTGEECRRGSLHYDEENGDGCFKSEDSQKRSERHPSSASFGHVLREEQRYRKGHRRNVAALRISTTVVSTEEHIEKEAADEYRGQLPILASEPVSPAGQLRVKESIAHLMKALPPLPREARRLSHQDSEIAVSARTCDDVLHPNQGHVGEEMGDLEVKPLPSPMRSFRDSHDSPPKFKIRAKRPPSSAEDGSPRIMSPAEEANAHASPKVKASPVAKPRLKLKISRSQISQARVGRMPRLPNNRLKQCNSLAELGPFPRNNASVDKHRVDSPIVDRDVGNDTKPQPGHDGDDGLMGEGEEQDEREGEEREGEEREERREEENEEKEEKGEEKEKETEKEKDEEDEAEEEQEEGEEEPSRFGLSSLLSDQFNIAYPAVLPERIDSLPHFSAPVPRHIGKERLDESASVSSQDNPGGQRGLRSKLSMFRLRFIGTSSGISSNKSDACGSALKPTNGTLPPLPSEDFDLSSNSMVTERSRRAQERRGQNGWRIKRWAHDAKKAVRSYVKKTLDR